MYGQATKALHPDVNASMDAIDWLSNNPIFQGLDHGALSKFADGGVVRDFAALEEAVVEGEMHSSLNIVVFGRFVILLPGEHLRRFGDNAMINLECYLAGDSFGEVALLDEGMTPALASIVATEVSRVLSISRVNFQRAVGNDNPVGQAIYRNLFEMQTRRLNALTG